jgi:hypothetical protein
MCRISGLCFSGGLPPHNFAALAAIEPLELIQLPLTRQGRRSPYTVA